MTTSTPRASLRLLSAVALVLASAAVAWGQMPITGCGEVGTGLWRLTQNLSVTLASDNDACIKITESNVEIDLRGHTITGNGVGYGILGADNIKHIIVHNGRIQNFATGVNLAGENDNSIEYVTLDRLVVSKNTGDGIVVNTRATITDTTANGNRFTGIWVASGYVTLDAVTVVGNGNAGIQSDGSDACCVTATRVLARKNGSRAEEDGVTGSGIYLAGHGNVITQSTAEGNADHGIEFSDIGDHNVVVSVIARNNGLTGIHIGPDEDLVS